MKLEDHIRRYLQFVARADRMFESVAKAHPEALVCRPGCDDCCCVYFELSLIEAFYISGMFNEKVSSAARERALLRAEQADPIFRQAKAVLHGCAKGEALNGTDTIETAARFTIPCPLNEDKGCLLYEDRPVTCRLYGSPQKIRDKVITCPLSGFRKGEHYTTVDVDEVQRTLHKFSHELLLDLLDIVVPDSMIPLFTMSQVLQTKFDKEFFLSLKRTIH